MTALERMGPERFERACAVLRAKVQEIAADLRAERLLLEAEKSRLELELAAINAEIAA
jgi:hypothetical protein